MPLSALAGLVVALLLRLAAATVDAVAQARPLPPLLALAGLPRPAAVALRRRAALAGNVSGRAPPAGFLAA